MKETIYRNGNRLFKALSGSIDVFCRQCGTVTHIPYTRNWETFFYCPRCGKNDGYKHRDTSLVSYDDGETWEVYDD